MNTLTRPDIDESDLKRLSDIAKNFALDVDERMEKAKATRQRIAAVAAMRRTTEKYKTYLAKHQREEYLTTSGRARHLFNSARQSARIRHLVFDLTREWIAERLERGHCEVTKLPFDLSSVGSKRKHPFGPSLDKVDPAKGYTTDNVRVVVWIYNIAKSDFTLEAVDRFCRAYCAIHQVLDEVTP